MALLDHAETGRWYIRPSQLKPGRWYANSPHIIGPIYFTTHDLADKFMAWRNEWEELRERHNALRNT